MMKVLYFFLILPCVLQAEVILAPLFQDGAVLQREQEIRIWGKAEPGERIRVEFAGSTQDTTATADGRWIVVLPPQPASTEPKTLTVQGQNTIMVHDILIGELWLCSGQSNMAWTVGLSNDAENELKSADYPMVRLYQVPKTSSEAPAFSVGGQWLICSPDSAANFSAVAYYFGRHLHLELGIPIGLINSSWGATHIESWISDSRLKATPVYPEIEARWQEVLQAYPEKYHQYEQRLKEWKAESQKATARGEPFKQRMPRSPDGAGSRMEPSGLYNGMIHPFTPASIGGVIWYQGESNAVHHEEYEVLFQALIGDWRACFKQPHLPFYFVQLANVVRNHDKTGEEFSYIREAQRKALSLHATGMVVTVDIGEDRNIHPGNKQDVGKRLAYLALANLFQKNIVCSGPTARNVTRIDNRILIEFGDAQTLIFREDGGSGFELASKEGNYFPARVRIQGTSVILESEKVKAPSRVRYAWGNTPPVTLFNESGLPASPFVIEL